MQSDSGIAKQAANAMARGEEDEAELFIEELRRRYSGRPHKVRHLLAEAGWPQALASCIALYAHGKGGEIKRLYRSLLTYADEPTARQLLNTAFVDRAREPMSAQRLQRLFKVACRYLDPVQFAEQLHAAQIEVIIPLHIMAMMRPRTRDLPLAERPRSSALVVD